MKTSLLLSIAGFLAAPIAHAMPNSAHPEVERILSNLSLEEKIGQMVQLDLLTVAVPGSSPIRLDPARLREALVTYKVGSFINNGAGRALSIEEWTHVHRTIQDLVRSETPNKVPLLYGIDSIHGATYVRDATLFPQNINMAATRNPDLMRRASEISALETRAAGLRWTFAPVLDVGRQPLWARFPETFGEDPLLASVLGAESIRGFQGTDVSSHASVAACMKHYVGYSFPFTGRDRTPALMPDHYLREYFLPPFREAVKAGVKTVMLNSGEVNGVPVHSSRYLLADVLRGELGFSGVIVSDWEDVIRLHKWHGVAETPADAVRLAVEAGLDISMVPLDFSFFTLLKQLVNEGKVGEARIDESVRRILTLKWEVGLFRNPYVEPETAGQHGRAEYRQVALQAAEESLVLLKNEQSTLPLPRASRVLVTGPAADSISALHGCWSFTWQGKDESQYPRSTLNIVDAIREKIGTERVLHRKGAAFEGDVVAIEETLADAAKADAIVLCLGEDAYAETPGDLGDLNLPAGQQELARRLMATGKPVVLVLVEGRPRIIRDIEPSARAILFAGWPGSEGARAIANVLFGDANPSGKLPFTYPRHANHLVTYDRKYPEIVNQATTPEGRQPSDYQPQYDFGHGLSYTSLELRNLKLSSATLKKDETLSVTVDVVNTGPRPGKEVVELYTRDLFASLTPPQKRLRAFRKVALQTGADSTVSFELRPSDIAFVNAESKTVTEPGEFEVIVGTLKQRFRYE